MKCVLVFVASSKKALLLKSLIFVLFFQHLIVFGQTNEIQKIKEFENVNHPQIAFWLFSPCVYATEGYLNEIDSIAKKGKFTLVFLSARQGANFYNADKMRPIFAKLVNRAHQNSLKIGLQLNEDEYTPVALPNTECIITDYEAVLNENGKAEITATAKHVRHTERIIKTDLLKAYAFKKTSEGFYQPNYFKRNYFLL